jgi:hypothetical protein
MTLLDAAVPEWQFRERHSIQVAASAERTFAALRAVTAREIFLFRTLTFVRRFGRRGPASILNAPPDEPILDVATRSGFRVVSIDPPREIVLAIDVASKIFAAMNFLVDGERLSTETRIATKGVKAKAIFGAYWFAIRLGSGFIRRMWLRAIKKRAEQSE